MSGLTALRGNPAYTLPGTFTVGTQKLNSPLVNVSQLKAHLSLLRAIRSMKIIAEAAVDKRRPWSWFVGLAVERFQRWVETLKPHADWESWLREELPPLDVLMVWHAYTLNPMCVLAFSDLISVDVH